MFSILLQSFFVVFFKVFFAFLHYWCCCPSFCDESSVCKKSETNVKSLVWKVRQKTQQNNRPIICCCCHQHIQQNQYEAQRTVDPCGTAPQLQFEIKPLRCGTLLQQNRKVEKILPKQRSPSCFWKRRTEEETKKEELRGQRHNFCH